MNKQTNIKTSNLHTDKNIRNLLAVYAKPLNKQQALKGEEDKKINQLRSKVSGASPLLGENKTYNNKNSLFLSVLKLNLQGLKLYDQLLTNVVNKPGYKTQLFNSKKSAIINENLNNKLINTAIETKTEFLNVNTKNNTNKIENFVYNLKKEFMNKNINLIKHYNQKVNLPSLPSISSNIKMVDGKGLTMFSNVIGANDFKLNSTGKIALKEGMRNYMKTISEFNSKIATCQLIGNNSFNFNVANNKTIKNIESLLESFFISISIFISKPIFEITPDKVTLRLFYYFLSNKKGRSNFNFNNFLNNNKVNKKNFLSSKKDKLQLLVKILNYFFKKPVELELVRLYTPFSDSKILVQILALVMNRIKFNKIKKRVLKGTFSKTPNKWKTKKIFSLDPSFLSGIKIKIAGRLLTHRVIPRKTVKLIHKGILARSRVISNDTARFTNKNKRGAYSITVSITNILKNN